VEAVGGLLAREGRASPKTFHLLAEPELLLQEHPSSLPLSRVTSAATNSLGLVSPWKRGGGLGVHCFRNQQAFERALGVLSEC